MGCPKNKGGILQTFSQPTESKKQPFRYLLFVTAAKTQTPIFQETSDLIFRLLEKICKKNIFPANGLTVDAKNSFFSYSLVPG